MKILGVHAGWWHIDEDHRCGVAYHDTAAALVDGDGQIMAAAEEERFTRIKHCNVFPRSAIQFCLNHANITIDDVDIIAIPVGRDAVRTIAWQRRAFNDRWGSVGDVSRLADGTSSAEQEFIGVPFERAFASDVRSKIRLCDHHVAHAWSAFAASGYKESLIIVLDGNGEPTLTPNGLVVTSGLVAIGRPSGIEVIRHIPVSESLGLFYARLIRFIGYHRFDEYKAMGLAPSGRAVTSVLDDAVSLQDDGRYRVAAFEEIAARLVETGGFVHVRRRHEPFSQWHKDLSFAIQRATERAILHVASFFAKETGLAHLCVAGGVGQNCSANGQVYYSGLFKRVFFQPAAHDAGLTIGAAMHALKAETGLVIQRRIRHLALGAPVPRDVEDQLARWQAFIKITRKDVIERTCAELIENGHVIGWVQGRSEFGPRALGNRSILADPRPRANRERINQVVKKRESFRPFAPAILAEYVDDVCELSERTVDDSLPFMISTLRVRPEWADRLEAVTHLDRTARVQVVQREDAPLFWNLIDNFRQLTGIPALLNTSFNNNVEPIVNDIDDVIVCFLTTELEWVAVGDYAVEKRSPSERMAALDGLSLSLPTHRVLARDACGRCFLDSRCHAWLGHEAIDVSEEMFDALSRCDGHTLVGALALYYGEERDRFYDEIAKLWNMRAVCLRPAS
jgi:carbamoyltransferase